MKRVLVPLLLCLAAASPSQAHLALSVSADCESKVYLDGTYLGKTPLEKSVPHGTYTLKLENVETGELKIYNVVSPASVNAEKSIEASFEGRASEVRHPARLSREELSSRIAQLREQYETGNRGPARVSEPPPSVVQESYAPGPYDPDRTGGMYVAPSAPPPAYYTASPEPVQVYSPPVYATPAYTYPTYTYGSGYYHDPSYDAAGLILGTAFLGRSFTYDHSRNYGGHGYPRDHRHDSGRHDSGRDQGGHRDNDRTSTRRHDGGSHDSGRNDSAGHDSGRRDNDRNDSAHNESWRDNSGGSSIWRNGSGTHEGHTSGTTWTPGAAARPGPVSPFGSNGGRGNSDGRGQKSGDSSHRWGSGTR